MDTSDDFLVTVSYHQKVLAQFNFVTKKLQTGLLTLSEGRKLLDGLVDFTKHANQANVGHIMYQCGFQSKYIKPDSLIVKAKHFEAGVVKIQRGEYNQLSDDARIACESLLKPANATPAPARIPNRPAMIEFEMLMQQTETDHNSVNCPYINSDFILASAAVVERLWSLAGLILTDNRKGMTPHLFEALLYLKVNDGYWTRADVVEVRREAQKVEKSARLDKHLREDALQEENVI